MQPLTHSSIPDLFAVVFLSISVDVAGIVVQQRLVLRAEVLKSRYSLVLIAKHKTIFHILQFIDQDFGMRARVPNLLPVFD